jgi:hypothetical protein
MNCQRRFGIYVLAAALLTMMAVNVSARAEEWKAHEVRQLGEKPGGVRMPAKLQIVTESWNRVVAVPYIVFMSEKDRLLMLVSCDYPHRPMVLTSDDRGASWSKPQPILPDEPAHARHLLGVSLTYLGDGQVLCGVEGKLRCRSIDYGQTWSSDPIPPNPHGGGWNQWDPYLGRQSQRIQSECAGPASLVGQQPGDLHRPVARRKSADGFRNRVSLAAERPGHVVTQRCRAHPMAHEQETLRQEQPNP